MDPLRKGSLVEPKTLFAFHPHPLQTREQYPTAFSAIPSPLNLGRRGSQPIYPNDIFSPTHPMMPIGINRGNNTTYSIPAPTPTPRSIPSVLAQPAVDPSSEVWPPLPPRAQNPTIAPSTLSGPLEYITTQEFSFPMAQVQVPQVSEGRDDVFAFSPSVLRPVNAPPASVLHATPSVHMMSGSGSQLEGWHGQGSGQAQGIPITASERAAQPILTCVPLNFPPRSAESYKVIAPLPKAPRIRTPSKSTPKARKVSRSAAQPGFGFVNFTANDADKLLTGVAPSGSQKRKRDVSGGSQDGDAAGLPIGDAKRIKI